MRISLCMIVRDEARYLAQCLRSVAGVVDEIVVVDTGSTDGTPDLARSFGAAVYAQPWENDFAKARNASLERASGDWILVLDADEALTPEAASALRPFAEHTPADGVQLIQRSFLPENELCRYQDLHITRLFRNRPAYRYEEAIHEQIQPSILRSGGRITTSPLVLHHFGYAQQTVQGGRSRAERNRALLEAALAARPDDAYLCYQLGITYRAQGDDARAAAYLRRALSLGTNGLSADVRATLFTRLGQLELGADRYESALDFAVRALAVDPENVVATYVAALARMFLGRIDEAYPLFMRVRRSPGCNPSTWQHLDAVIRFCEEQLGRQPAGAGASVREDQLP